MSIMYQTVFVLCNKNKSKQTQDRAYKVVDAFENECENEHAWWTNDNDDGSEIWWVVKWMKDGGNGNAN